MFDDISNDIYFILYKSVTLFLSFMLLNYPAHTVRIKSDLSLTNANVMLLS